MAISPDGETIVNTSETTNMAHFIDFASEKMVASTLVDARPRNARFKHDGSEVWVSSELGGTVSSGDGGKLAVSFPVAKVIDANSFSEAARRLGISRSRLQRLLEGHPDGVDEEGDPN